MFENSANVYPADRNAQPSARPEVSTLRTADKPSGMRVFIIDPNAESAQQLKTHLHGGEPAVLVDVASSVEQALEDSTMRAPDAVLVDIATPDVVESVRRLRNEIPAAAVVVVSKTAEDSAASEAVKAGAQDHVVTDALDGASIRRALRYAVERQQMMDRLALSEARLQEENRTLRGLTDAANRVFATLDVRSVPSLLATEAQRLWSGSAALYARRSTGALVCIESAGSRPKADAFLRAAFDEQQPVLSEDGLRVAVPIPGTSGRNEWLLDIRGRDAFVASDVFALGLLRRYVGTAIQNLALFGELQAQRSSVITVSQLKDDLIAVLAHDFKGPLTTIIGFTELLEQHALEGEDERAALRTIRQSATRLAGLANDTLALSRVEQGELQFAADPVDVTAVVQETVTELAAARRIDLTFPSRPPLVCGDPARLHQVFENIIGNAVKYSPGGEPVTVRVSENEQTVRVSVEDRGIGVPTDELRFLFERFKRASNAKRSKIHGTGLGLYLARTLVERHGGTIQVQSIVGSGSTFTVVLPRLREGVGVLRIIVATADENIGPYMLHELRAHGLAVRREKTLTGVMERLDHEAADIVIVDRDSVTSDMGILFNRARASHPRIGLVAIGGDRDARTAGAWDASLPNPFLAADLQTAVNLATRARAQTSV